MQHGLITHAQLRELGVSRSTVRTRLANGQWLAADTSVLRIGGAPVTWESQLLAAVLGAGGSAAASHFAAARLWGLRGYEQARLELTVNRSCSFRRRGVIVHRLGDHELEESVSRSHVPVTPIGRTLLDLGAVETRSQVEAAVLDAVVKGLIGWNGLLDTFVRYGRRGRDGVGALRAILAKHIDAVGRVDGGCERMALVMARNANLPRAELGPEVEVDGELRRVGLAFPDHKVALQLRNEEDVARRGAEPATEEARIWNAAVVAGWTMLGYTDQDLVSRPGPMIRQIRSVLRGQGPGETDVRMLNPSPRGR